MSRVVGLLKTRSLQTLLRSATLLAVLAVAASLGSSLARAEDFGIARLMQLLAASPLMEVPYTEQKFSSLLNEPVVSSGTLAFRPPDTVEKNMMAPRLERYRIAGDALVITRKHKETRIPLSSQPLIEAFAASLRGVLTGDAALLRNHYRLGLEGTEQAWHLTLTPLDAGIGRYVETIVVSGRGGRVGQIEVQETSGDRSVTQVR